MLLFRDVLYRLWLEMKGGVCACESLFVGVICGREKYDGDGIHYDEQ